MSNEGKIIGTQRNQIYPLVSLIEEQFRRKLYESGSYTIVELQIKGITESQKEKFIQDIQIMKQTRHTNIAQVYDHFPENNFYYIIIGGDCKKTFRNYFKGKRCQQNTLLSKIKELIQANKQLFKKGSLIRSFKPANIIMPERKYEAILMDFDFSKFIEEPNKIILSVPANELVYMAPQLLMRHKYTQKSGVWSLGIILYQILTSRLPWNASNSEMMLQNMQKKEIKFEGVYVSEKTKKLLNKMLEFQQERRIGMEELEHQIRLIVEIYTLPSRQRGKSLTCTAVKRLQQHEDSLQKYQRNKINEEKKSEKNFKKIKQSKIKHKNKVKCSVTRNQSCQLYPAQSVPKPKIFESDIFDQVKLSVTPAFKKCLKDQTTSFKQNSKVSLNKLQHNNSHKQVDQNHKRLDLNKKEKARKNTRQSRLMSQPLNQPKLQQKQRIYSPLQQNLPQPRYQIIRDSPGDMLYKANFIIKLVQALLESDKMKILTQKPYHYLIDKKKIQFQSHITSFYQTLNEQIKRNVLLIEK